MDYLGVNPVPASTAGQETMTLSENFKGLKGALMSNIESCREAAFEVEVTRGYEDFEERWATDLEKTAAHGESVGGNTTITVSDSVGVDLDNGQLFGITPPGVAKPDVHP